MNTSIGSIKVCPQCHTSFSCNPSDCWCSTLPPIMPVAAADCYCPQCLKAIIDKELSGQPI